MMASGSTTPRSCEIDWGSCVRPLLAAAYGNSTHSGFGKLIHALASCKEELLNHSEEDTPFYTSFVALCTHFVSSHVQSASRSQFPDISGAFQVLCEYLVKRMEVLSDDCAVSPSQFVSLLKSLCSGGGCLTRSDVITLAAHMKSSHIPRHIRTTMGQKQGEEESAESTKEGRNKGGVSVNVDPLGPVMNILLSPMADTSCPVGNKSKDKEIREKSFKSFQDQFANENIQILIHLGIQSVLALLCLKMPTLVSLAEASLDSVKNNKKLTFPATETQWTEIDKTLSNLCNEVENISAVLELRVWEGAGADVLAKLGDVVCLTIIASGYGICARHHLFPENPSEENRETQREKDSTAYLILHSAKSSLSASVRSIFRSSSGGGMPMLQNFRALESVCLLSILNNLLADFKINVCIVELVEHLNAVLCPLMKDAKNETNAKTNQINYLDVVEVCSSWQRIQFVSSHYSILEIYVTIALGAMKSVVGNSADERTLIRNIDSDVDEKELEEPKETKPAPVTHSESGDSSSSILGNWLEELLASVPQLVENAQRQSQLQQLSRRKSAAADSATISGNLKETFPETKKLLLIGAETLKALNNNLAAGGNIKTEFLRSFVRNTIKRKEATAIAEMITMTDSSGNGRSTEFELGEMSVLLPKLVHNLLVNDQITPKIQDYMLEQILGVSIESDDDWPCRIGRRSLAAFGQIFLLRLHKESQFLSERKTEEQVVGILDRFIQKLKHGVNQPSRFQHRETYPEDDVNVEHFQLMLVFFQALERKHKFIIFEKLRRTLVEIGHKTAKLEAMSPHLGRLVLFMDYILRHFYQPTGLLMDQVGLNVFSLVPAKGEEDRAFFSSLVEESYRSRVPSSDQVDLMPLFYNLCPTINEWLEEGKVPKVDSMALNALAEDDSYLKLYQTLVSLKRLGPYLNNDSWDPRGAWLRALEYGSVFYVHETVCGVLSQLPLPLGLIKEVVEKDHFGVTPEAVAHLICISSRFQSSLYQTWQKDFLIKGGVSDEVVSSYITRITDKFADRNFVLRLCSSFMELIEQEWKSEESQITYCHVVLVDTVVGFLRSFIDPDGNLGLKETRKEFTTEENNVFRIVFRVLKKLHQIAKRLLISEAGKQGSCDLMSLEDDSTKRVSQTAAELLLEVASSACPSNQPCLMEPGMLGKTTEAWLPPSMASSFLLWKTVQGLPESLYNSLTKETAVQSETQMTETFLTHIGGLLYASSHSGGFLGVRETLNSVESLVCDVILGCRFSESQLCTGEVDDVLLPHVFSVYLPSPTCQKIHNVLLAWHQNKDDQKVLFLKENSYFLDKCFNILTNYSDINDGLPDECLLLVIDALTRHVKRTITWPAWATFDSGIGLGERLLSNFSTRERSPLVKIEWINLIGAILDNCVSSGSSNGDMEKVVEGLVVPQLLSKPLMEKWADILTEDINDKEKRKEEAIKTVMSFLRSLHALLSTPSCASMRQGWEEASGNIALDVSLRVLESIRFYPLDPVWPLPANQSPCASSDRWGDSKLTPAIADMCADMLGREGLDSWFNRMFQLTLSLAQLGSGRGLPGIARSAMDWLNDCKEKLTNKSSLRMMEGKEEGTEEEVASLIITCDTTTTLLTFLSTLMALFRNDGGRSDRQADISIPDYEKEFQWNLEELEGEEEESGGEESGEEEGLDSKLCTFTITQKDFMSQHWYHCHTCGMVDGEGVCSICAKVCHKDHDLSYSKFGSFFCDCGAKQDGSCQALTKRSRSSSRKLERTASSSSSRAHTVAVAFESDSKSSSLRKTLVAELSNSTIQFSNQLNTIQAQLKEFSRYFNINKSGLSPQLLEALSEQLTEKKTNPCQQILTLLSYVLPAISAGAAARSKTGALGRQRKALNDMATMKQLPINRSRQICEGLFENVKPNFTGYQGHNIRQLVQSHIIHRVSITTLTFKDKKRQYLVVSHDRCKVTVLPVSNLFKQADNGKKTLSLHRAAFESLPFTVLTLSSSDEFIAISGLKECHILIMASSGAVSDKIVIQPSLETGNFIIKAAWLPALRGQLALVTADFVNIYDLTVDLKEPQFHFLLPAGKIRDVCFAFWEDGKSGEHSLEKYILLFSSMGHVYMQQLNDSCGFALHGAFFVTSSVPVCHPELEDTTAGGNIGGGGVSLHFSHTLQLLFLSYSQGKNFVVSFNSPMESIVGPILLNSGGDGKDAPLYNWLEEKEYPGIVLATSQSSANPILFYFGPQELFIQELSNHGRNKALDCMALVQESWRGEKRLAVTVLCEDGSIHITKTGDKPPSDFLLSPSLPSPLVPSHTPYSASSSKRKRGKTSARSGQTSYIDFFESCQQINDIEFGGADLLQVYNVHQLKNRLNTAGQYVACAKSGGFDLELIVKEPNMVVCGLRIELGKYSVDKSPTFVDIFGWRKEFRNTRPRWYDIPLSRQESLAASARFTIRFGASVDGNNVPTIVDSVKLYGKSKEAFGWCEELEEGGAIPTAGERGGKTDRGAGGRVGEGATRSAEEGEKGLSLGLPQPLIPEILLINAFNALENYFTAFPNGNDRPKSAVDLATGILCTNIHLASLEKAKSVLRLMFASDEDYYNHKDRFLLNFVWTSLPIVETTNDSHLFAFLLVITRNIAKRRPANLVQFASELNDRTFTDSTLSGGSTSAVMDKSSSEVGNRSGEGSNHDSFVETFLRIFWKLLNCSLKWPHISPLGATVVTNAGSLVGGLVEIFHGICTADPEFVGHAAEFYTQLLLCQDVQVGQACRQTLMGVFKQRVKKKKPPTISPQRCSTPASGRMAPQPPDEAGHILEATPPPPQAPPPNEPMGELAEMEPPFEMLPPPHHNPLEALLAVAEADGEDEENLVELAIALSLQDNSGGSGNEGEVDMFQQADLVHPPPELEFYDAGLLSDVSVLSEEEGSTAATDGSTLRISPAEEGALETPGSGNASESGNDSVSGEGGVNRSETCSSGQIMPETQEAEAEASKVRGLQSSLLKHMLSHLGSVPPSTPGVRFVALMQTLLLLSSHLSGMDAEDRDLIDLLLANILDGLHLRSVDADAICSRSAAGELRLLKLRLLSVLLSKSKGRSKTQVNRANEYLAIRTAHRLMEAGIVEYCRQALNTLLGFWQGLTEGKKAEKPKVVSNKVAGPPLDLSPFFLRQYVKEHSEDIFEHYAQLITEMALRLPYQVRKVRDYYGDGPRVRFEGDWESLLCQFVSCEEAPFVRRQARKLLLVMAGSKDNYRLLRDGHNVERRMEKLRQLCASSSGQTRNIENLDRPLNLSYTQLNEMMEHLKAVTEVAQNRPHNWQKLCLKKDDSFTGVVGFLFRLAVIVNDVIGSVVLDLIQSCLCPPKGSKTKTRSTGTGMDEGAAEEKDAEDVLKGSSKFNVQAAKAQSGVLLKESFRGMLVLFLRRFLLRSNVSEHRWQVHDMVRKLFRYGSVDEQNFLLKMLQEDLWEDVRRHGSKASLLVDLMGYYTVQLTPAEQLKDTADTLLEEFKGEVEHLVNHPNANLYTMLGSVLDGEGYFLEDNPCLVCNNPEVPMQSLKLNSIKMDSRFTTTSQIVKLIGSHEIARIFLKFTDIKRPKMVKDINVFYSNKAVGSAVELKNKPDLWSLAKQITLTPGQTDMKMDFPVPIVACNFKIEFADFFEGQKSGSELLHCPRCSASVPANPGVCGNCGENVFQCHKCRSINYDEKDPFLCNSCGFSKYAKYEVTFHARQVAGVEPIDNAEDRKKTLTYINALLEKAEQSHRQLTLYRAQMELGIAKLNGQINLPQMDGSGQSGHLAGVTVTQNNSVNRVIQEVATKYCRDAKLAFEDLSRTIQRLLANRAELLQYDSREGHRIASTAALGANFVQSSRDCFGCVTAQALHCLTLLRALVTVPQVRKSLSKRPSVILQLFGFIRRGPPRFTLKVQELLCELCRDSPDATDQLCTLIFRHVHTAISDNRNSALLGKLVQHEMQLLRASMDMMDQCWESRLRCAFKLFLVSLQAKSGSPVEHVSLPCLQIIHWLLLPPSTKPSPSSDTNEPGNQNKKEKKRATDTPVSDESKDGTVVDLKEWLLRNLDSTQPQKAFSAEEAVQIGSGTAQELYFMHKYGGRWLRKHRKSTGADQEWLEKALFCGNSLHVRAAASIILKQICASSPNKKAGILDLITEYTFRLSRFGERASEFVGLFKSLIAEEHWKFYLTVRGFLPKLGKLIGEEVERLGQLEMNSVATDLTQGYTVRVLAELLQDFMSVENIRKQWKGELLGSVLHGYLALRLLVVQRTKLIDDAQTRLLGLLEDLTTGTESERKSFMATCIETVNKYPMDDMRTPVFIFERLCSIIFPEEKEVGEFLINIEKDAAQEDFLQGRMMGNPYNSSEAAMSPLMKDIKNRICRDCELIALLDDDTGMELLVGGKIVSLDLPVAEVYRKLWLPQHQGEAMHIVYRMRGLLGDATEEFVETLDAKKDESVDEEETFRMGNVMGECGGLKAMIERLKFVRTMTQGRCLLGVVLKLLGYCAKVKKNRDALLHPHINTITVLLRTLPIILNDRDAECYGLAESLLGIIVVLLSEANKGSAAEFKNYSDTFGSTSDVIWLLSLVQDSDIMGNAGLKEKLMQVIPNLTLGSKSRMDALVTHFQPYLDFNNYDYETTPEKTTQLQCFCLMTKGIERSSHGSELKNRLIDARVVANAAEYLQMHCPPLFKVGLGIDSEWKEYLSKRGLKFALQILAGMCLEHEPSQMLVANAEQCIMIVHRLEQLSTEERLGSLAENLMEALRGNPKVAEKVEQVRKETKARKKQMAMAVRQMHLKELGVEAVKEAEELQEETGLTCSICREGYKSQPQKVLAIYTFTKRVNADDFEVGTRKQPAYTTVTHFNVIHVDCHVTAVRMAGSRDEWESGMLHNANTRCNGLLPLWGPNVPESNFANCLARHNIYVQEQTQLSDISFHSGVQDLKLLLRRFADGRSFSEETGGGGKESNIQLIPCLSLLCLYVMNASRIFPTERRHLTTFLSASPSEWAHTSFHADGPQYYSTAAVLLLKPSEWNKEKLVFLKRLIFLAQARYVSPQGCQGKLKDVDVKEWMIYKPYVFFFGIIDGVFKYLLQNVKEATGKEDWCKTLQEYLRANDVLIFEQCKKLLRYFEDDLSPSASFQEFLDVAGLVSDISDGVKFVQDTLVMAS